MKVRTLWRALFLAALALSWFGMVGLMVREFRTVPTAEQLADDRAVRPPLPQDLVNHIAISGIELIFATVLLWPWWRRRYGRRALLAATVLGVWFVYSAPMSLNRMELQHRRWLALLVAAALSAALAALAARVFRGRHVSE